MRSYNYPYSLSLANGASGSGSSSSSSPSHYYNGFSHHQLRSNFSQPASTSYVTRSHLPFVSQSMLVAHCYTSGQSSSNSSSRSYSGASFRSPASSSGYSSLSSRGSSLSVVGNNYSPSSRPSSTKRPQVPSQQHYLASTSTSSSLSAATRASYLAPPASRYSSPSTSYSRPAAGSFRSSYRPSSAYQPIRLRERPLLAQLRAGTSSEPSRTHSRSILAANTAADAVKNQLESASRQETGGLDRARLGEKVADEETKEAREKRATSEEVSWQADVGRNISRNKYIIKFRERESSIANLDDKVKQLELSDNNTFADASKPTREMRIKVSEPEPELALHATLIVAPSSKEAPSADLDLPKIAEPTCESGGAATTIKKEPKERRNIKLKIKAVNSNKQQQLAPAGANEISLDRKTFSQDTKTPTPPEQPSPSPSASPQSKTTRPKRLVPKTSKTARAAVASGQTTASASLESPGAKPKTARLIRKRTDSSTGLAGSDSTATSLSMTPEVRASPKSSKLIRRKASVSLPSQEADTTKRTAEEMAVDMGQPKQIDAEPNKRVRFRNYHIDDFDFVSVLGHGGWGFVILAELKGHDICFAVKCIKKITIIEDDDFESIMIERKVLALGNINPFICKLFCTFETNGYLFFVMEFCAGGDLMFHVQKEGKFSEPRCRFYAAEIICAIRFLHNKHIIYRDLKLDNILLDSAGHIRLVDFGMCQCRTYREEMLPSNFCGTPEYISPEIIKGVPYNHSVDWWSFGVLLYEMAVGKMPFRGNDENELLWNVCYENIHYPMFLSKELTSLLQLLLEREPTRRMGMASCKSGDIYEQTWFRGVDWPAMEAMRVQPPFVPQVESRSDVQNFDTDFTESRPELSPVDEATLERIDQNLFLKFPYTNPEIDIFAS